jgi:predicted ATPase
VDMPAVDSSLIGRARELDSVIELVRRGARIVTLVGPGGVGKTRLALALAGVLRGDFPDGVAFVVLAPLSDAALVIPTIASALGLRESASQSLRAGLEAHLRDRRLLLVLDNFEQVRDAATEVAALSAHAPGLVVVVTSRAPLRVRGEQEYPVPPLELPDLREVPQLAEISGNPAVALFVERAQAVAPDFELSRTNASAVAAIARRLDGLPLAIELAAARVRLLSPTTLLTRLNPVLPLLSHGARDLPKRQRTMHNAIQWSYDLLSPPQQALFRRLAVFRGGWTLEGAEWTATGGDVARDDVLDLLSDLNEQSLIAVEPGEATRVRMLEPIRQFAHGLLDVTVEGEAVRNRHADFYAALAAQAEAGMRGRDQVEWLARLDQEHDNLRAALDWLLRQGNLAVARRFVFSLWLFWWMRGHFSEGRRWVERSLAADPAPPDRAWVQLVAGVLDYGQGNYEPAELANNVSLAMFGQSGDEHGLALATAMAGLIALGREQYERASALLAEGVERCLRVGDKWSAAMQLSYAAAMELRRGDSHHAAQLTEQALTLGRELGDRVSTYTSLYNLASLAQMHQDYLSATRLFIEGLDLSVEMGDRGNTAYCLEGLAEVAAEQGDAERAAQSWAAAEALLATVEAAVYAHMRDRSRQAEAIARARSQIDEQNWQRAWQRGRGLSWEQAVEEARASSLPVP